MKLLIDGDILVFRSAFSAEDEEEPFIACARANTMIQEMCAETGASDYEVWLSGPKNFRYDIYPEYKANRIKSKRPKWELCVKQYLIIDHNANWSDGCEADDMLGVRQYQLKDSCIATIDKDLKQIKGNHYNFVTKQAFVVTAEEADRFFYYQMLTGDPTDNIKGVYNIGPKKADRILSESEDILQTLRDLYSCDEEMLMNADVLYIWREIGDKSLVHKLLKQRAGFSNSE